MKHNRISSAFISKYKNQNLSQNSLSLSKLNTTESKIKSYPKKDYFAILTQIKNQNINLATSPTLFHYFIKKNAQKSINIRLSHLAKLESKESLLTEPNTTKNISFRKTSFNKSFRDKYLKNNIEMEIHKLPVNKVLKLKKDKIIFKPLEEKKYIPMERRDSYTKFINKMKKVNYFKYENSNSGFAHDKKTEIYLNLENEKEKLEKKRNEKYMQILRDKFEEGKENDDKVIPPSLEIEKLKKTIRAILLKDSEEQPEEFFNDYVNKVNFIKDGYKPPNIKNNLINHKYKDLYGFEKIYGLRCLNRISKNTLNNLAKAKIRAQREKEFKLNYLKEKGKITKKYLFYKKLASNDIYNSKEEIEKIIYKDYYIKPEDLVRILKKDTTVENDEENIEHKNYFEDKYEKFYKVFIPEPKLRRCVLHNFINNS